MRQAFMKTCEKVARLALDVATRCCAALGWGDAPFRAGVRTAVRKWHFQRRLRRGLPASNLLEAVVLNDLVSACRAEAVFGFLPEDEALPRDARADLGSSALAAVKTGLAELGALTFDLVYFQPHCDVRQTAEGSWSTSLCEAFCLVARKEHIPLVVSYPSQTAVLYSLHCGPVVYLVPPASRLRSPSARRRHRQLLEAAELLLLDSSAEGNVKAAGKPVVRLADADALTALAARYSIRRPQERETSVNVHGDVPVVDLLTFYFFDWQGDSLRLGGAERYILDLSRLLRVKGFRPRIVQNSLQPFEKSVDGVEVVGMAAARRADPGALFRHYLSNYPDSARLVCSPLTLACRPSNRRIIGINHSVGWDYGDWSRRRFDSICSAVEASQAVVCVDTNFVNWMRTIDWRLSRKLVYIPNYYDPAVFQPREKSFDDDEIIISFPRSLYEAKGVYHAFEMIRRVAPRFENAKFLFAGQVEHGDVVWQLEELAERFPGRVTRVELSFDEIADVYHRSQIVLVPTIHSEGTSLTCIEALAANNAVVASNVGGLSNLILNDFNGLLIPPTESDLERAVTGLLADREKRAALARNGLASVQPFQKPRWEQQWSRLIDVW